MFLCLTRLGWFSGGRREVRFFWGGLKRKFAFSYPMGGVGKVLPLLRGSLGITGVVDQGGERGFRVENKE
jgi:hypothetical protein